MKKKKVLIIDAYNPAHVGNGVLLKSSIDVINRAFPENRLQIATLDIHADKLVEKYEYSKFLFEFPAYQSKFKKVTWLISNIMFIALHYINIKTLKIKPSFLTLNPDRRETLKRMEDADVVISITGEGIRDTMHNVLPFILFTYWLAAKLGKKMIIFPQSIGPLNFWWTRRLVGMTLPQLTLVVARDQFAIAELDSLGIPKNKVIYCPDVGVIQPFYAEEIAKKSLQSLGVQFNKPYLIGLTVSECLELGMQKTDYISTVIHTLTTKFSKTDLEIIIMPANMPVNDIDHGDYDICEQVYHALKNNFDVYLLEARVYPPDEFKAIQTLFDIFISTRMHASIMATMALTPTITLNTQRKLFGYMKNLGLEKYSLDIHSLTEDILGNAIDEVLEKRSQIRELLKTQRDRFDQQINQFADVIKEICQ